MGKKHNTPTKEPKMTEQEFIAKFKKAGFTLYKTKEIERKLKTLYVIQKLANSV